MKIYFLLLLFFGLFFNQILSTQIINKTLEIHKNDNTKDIAIKNNWIVKIWVYENDRLKKHSGFIDIIDNETITLNSKPYKILQYEK